MSLRSANGTYPSLSFDCPTHRCIETGTLKMHHEDNFTSHGEMATSSAVQFHPFRRLPLELRKKIWALTSPGPCAVFSGEHECTRKEPELDRNTFLAVIHTSREARSQFLEGASNISASKNRVYQKYQVCQFAPSFKNVFFDFQRDTLVYMSAKGMHALLNSHSLTPIYQN